MRPSLLVTAFEATVLLSTVASLAVTAMALRRGASPAAARSIAQPEPGTTRGRLWLLLFHPLAQLLLVCALLYLNQVLFGAYILRAHGGSTAFISRFIPGGWFAIGRHDPFVELAARHVGDGLWLSPTLLRVQAFLELPFTMFAYLAVARLLGRRLYQTLCGPWFVALAALSFSMSFSLVELSLPNPFTSDDLLLRAIACVVTPAYIAWLARRETARSPSSLAADGPSGVLGLLAFLAGAGAIAYVVLALYDAFLLYNLAHLPRYASGLVLATVIAICASFGAPRIDAASSRVTGGGRGPSPAIDICVSALRAFTLLFFVPSLSLRYWSAHPTAVACGLLVVALAGVAGALTALRRARLGPAEIVRLAVAGALAIGAGGWAAATVLASSGHGMPELLLARLALSFLVVSIVAFRAVEIFVCWPKHEATTQADEA